MPARDFTLTTTAAALDAAADRAASAAAGKGTIPILGHLLLRADRDGLTMTGTNTDCQATTRAPADVERPGMITVPADTFAKIVRKLAKDAEVTLQAEAAGMLVTLRSGRARFKLASLDPDDFPEFALADVRAGFPYAVELAGKTLADILDRVAFAISTEETRYYLGGIFVHVVSAEDGPRLRLVATDGHRLARVETEHAEGMDPSMPGVIIPRAFVPELAKLAKDAGDAQVTLELSPNLVRLTADTTTLTSRLIDGTFPDYQRVIPTTFLREVRAPTLELIASLDRVRVLADKSKCVRLAFSEGLLAVTLDRPHDLFAGRDEVDAELTGPAGAVDFNGAFLADILKHTGGDTVRLKLGDVGDGAVIGDPAGTSLYVLMPMRFGTAGTGGDAEPEA